MLQNITPNSKLADRVNLTWVPISVPNSRNPNNTVFELLSNNHPKLFFEETFKVEVDVLKKEYTDSSLEVEAEYVSESCMRDEWGWSEIL